MRVCSCQVNGTALIICPWLTSYRQSDMAFYFTVAVVTFLAQFLRHIVFTVYALCRVQTGNRAIFEFTPRLKYVRRLNSATIYYTVRL